MPAVQLRARRVSYFVHPLSKCVGRRGHSHYYVEDVSTYPDKSERTSSSTPDCLERFVKVSGQVFKMSKKMNISYLVSPPQHSGGGSSSGGPPGGGGGSNPGPSRPSAPDKPFKCGYCNRGFAKKEHRKRHVMLVHHDVRRYACGPCGLRFGTQQNLSAHLETRKHRTRVAQLEGRAPPP